MEVSEAAPPPPPLLPLSSPPPLPLSPARHRLLHSSALHRIGSITGTHAGSSASPLCNQSHSRDHTVLMRTVSPHSIDRPAYTAHTHTPMTTSPHSRKHRHSCAHTHTHTGAQCGSVWSMWRWGGSCCRVRPQCGLWHRLYIGAHRWAPKRNNDLKHHPMMIPYNCVCTPLHAHPRVHAHTHACALTHACMHACKARALERAHALTRSCAYSVCTAVGL